MTFDYKSAFARTIGWVSPSELQELSQKKVAIAGLGGVGGIYCEVLARLGIQNFAIADLDHFEIANFNRQLGASVDTLGKEKGAVLRDRILSINPNAKIDLFPAGVTEANVDQFLDGVDLYVDGLDFFVLKTRRELFGKLREKRIPGLTVAPLGTGASLVVFDNESMSFDDYFGLHRAKTDEEMAIRFLAGVAPSLMHSRYVDRASVDFSNKSGPSTVMGCFLCGAVAGTEALKILLGRGKLTRAPRSLHYDPYLRKLKKMWVPMGYRNPLQKLKIWIIGQMLKRKGNAIR